MEAEIIFLQSDFAHIESLQAGLQWRENEEHLAGYIKRSIEIRQSKRTTIHLHHLNTNTLCSIPDSMTKAAQCYYQ